jgi:signal peptidase II
MGMAAGVPANRPWIFAAIVLVGAAADLITKQWVFGWRGLPNEKPVWWLVEDLLGIETAVNIGAVFGIGAGKGTLFATLSVLAGVAVVVWLFWFGAARSRWMCVSLALVGGGIIGNLYDRLGLWWTEGMPVEWKSGVRDWILMQAGDAYKWPNYNIADSLLVVGAAMLVWHSFFPGDDLTGDAATSDRAADDRIATESPTCKTRAQHDS